MLAIISVPAGSNLTNRILTNVGNIENNGLEFSINTDVVRNNRFGWNAGFNITWNTTEITKLSKVLDPKSPGNLVGGISGGTGNTIQIHSIGFAPYSFYVLRQVYDEDSTPLEGLYVDENGDGTRNDLDRYRYKSPNAPVFFGFSSNFNYNKWTLSFVLRSNLGNYVYNNVNSERVGRNIVVNEGILRNVVPDYLNTEFFNNQYYSDYYIQNGSFLRMDNLNLGYNLGNLFNDKANVQLSAIVQNVFVITNYSGLDPEISGGIDNNLYPRPRTFSFGINANF